MTDDKSFLETQRAHQREGILSQRRSIIAALRSFRISHPTRIGRDHRIVLGECRHDFSPFVPGLRPTVKQHHRKSLTANDIMETDPIDLCCLMSKKRL